MAFVFFDQGEELSLKAFLNHTAGQNLVLKLFKNDHTPAESDDESDYTEADFTGYSAKTLTGASWVVTPGAPTVASYAQQEFESTANQTAQDIYGFFLVQATSGKAIGAERFGSPATIELNGQLLRVTPRFTQD